MSYAKPWRSYEEQLDQLVARGMQAGNRERSLDYLKRIGYYRLSGYWFAFRERSGPLVVLGDDGRKPKREKVETLALDSFRPHDVPACC
jgi:hypothetical protein